MENLSFNLDDPQELEKQLESIETAIPRELLNVALRETCHTGKVASCMLLKEAGASATAVDRAGRNAIHHAMMGKSNASDAFEILKILMGKNAASGSKSIKKGFVSRQAVNKKVGGRTPLYYATKKGFHECVQQLVTAGADFNFGQFEGSALAMAAERGHTETVKVLLDCGAAVNKPSYDRSTPLMHACSNKRLHCVVALIQRGANVNSADMYRKTPLMYAAGTNNLDIVKVLVEHGADVNVTDEDHAATPLWYAVNSKNLEIVEYLISVGAVETETSTPVTHAAVRHDSLNILIYLIDRNFCITRKARLKKKNIMHETCGRFAHKCLEYLLENHLDQFDLNAEMSGHYKTALDVAVGTAWRGGVSLLLKYGADPGHVNSAGAIALFQVLRPSVLGHGEITAVIETVVLLVRYGFDVDWTGWLLDYANEAFKGIEGIKDTTVIVLAAFCDLPCITKMLHCAGSKIPPGSVCIKVEKYLCDQNKDAQWWVDLQACLPSLAKLARTSIRKAMRTNIEKNIQKLPLPDLLKEYLNIPELDKIVQESKEFEMNAYDSETDESFNSENITDSSDSDCSFLSDGSDSS